MLKTTAVLLGVTAGLATLAPLANADTTNDNGVNVGNGNNVSVLPIQACGDNVAVLGAVVPLASAQTASCDGNGQIANH